MPTTAKRVEEDTIPVMRRARSSVCRAPFYHSWRTYERWMAAFAVVLVAMMLLVTPFLTREHLVLLLGLSRDVHAWHAPKVVRTVLR